MSLLSTPSGSRPARLLRPRKSSPARVGSFEEVLPRSLCIAMMRAGYVNARQCVPILGALFLGILPSAVGIPHVMAPALPPAARY